MKAEQLKKLFTYNPDTGELKWDVDRSNEYNCSHLLKGSIAGESGQVVINRVAYQTHIIAWTLFYGEKPVSNIRFIDRNRSNRKMNNMVDTASTTDRMCTTCDRRGGTSLFYPSHQFAHGFYSSCKICMDLAGEKPSEKRSHVKRLVIENPQFMPPIVVRSLKGKRK